MLRRRLHIKRVTLAVIGIACAALALPLAWLKAHETELVFQVATSRARVNPTLPPNFERIAITLAYRTPLAANILRAAPDHDNGLWVLHLHGNSETAFSNTQYEHVQVLR